VTGRILLLLASLAGSLLLGELAVRAFDVGPRFQVVWRETFQLSDDPVLGYELRPGSSFGPYTINAAGMRDEDVPLAKPPGVFRIAAIGDSVTFGAACRAEDAWVERLERALNARSGAAGTRFEVLNLGVIGYNITQSVQRLRALGLGYAPDLVLYGYLLNDPQAFSFEGEALAGSRAALERRFRAGLEQDSLLRLLARSRLFLLVRSLWLGRAAPSDPPPGVDRDPGYRALERDEGAAYFRALHTEEDSRRRFETGFADLARVGREAGVPVAVLLFPLFFDELGEGYPLQDLHAQVMQEAGRNGLPILDLRPAFAAAAQRHGERIRADVVHPGPLGHEVAASAALEWLDASGLLPSPPGGARR
jgi:lysophospholipase L1-like esterase